jgi:membrane-bound lytic murein transglycosylase A
VKFFTLALLALAACAPRQQPPPHLTLSPARFADLPGWRDDDVAAALPAFLRSCVILQKLDPAVPVGPDGVGGTAADWRAPCEAAASLDPAAARSFFEQSFTPWLAADNGKKSGLFTGYFEPELRGSRVPGGGFATPLLRRPPDLVAADLGLFRPDWRGQRIAGRVIDGRLLPYPARAEIERGALDRMNLAFLWVDDPVDAFVLSIQGSGRVRLGDGTLVNVGYDGQNGRPYVALGRLLVERGEMRREEV